jgi:hypothetical protein
VRIAYLKAKRARLVITLNKAWDTYDNIIGQGIEEYRFNSNEGSQSAKNLDIEKLQYQIQILEREIEQIDNILAGAGVQTITLRRYSAPGFPLIKGR